MSTSANDQPRAALYSFGGSVWAAVPLIGLVEKGYAESDLDVKQVNLLKGENFAPSYLRINPNGTVPTLVVPTAETTSAEVATKFRAITNSADILTFLDESRTQAILEAKGQTGHAAAPVLSPATIEGKAASDALIKMVHAPEHDPNFLLLSARTPQELEAQKSQIQGIFVNGQVNALKSYAEQVEAEARTSSSNPDANPRSAAHAEQLRKWYADKLQALQPLYLAYGPAPTEQAASMLVQLSVSRWAKLADALKLLDASLLKGPFALGDEFSLADAHLMAWLARVIAVAEGKQQAQGAKDVDALDKVLAADGHNGVVGPKLRAYWEALKARPSFQTVYKDGLH